MHSYTNAVMIWLSDLNSVVIISCMTSGRMFGFCILMDRIRHRMSGPLGEPCRSDNFMYSLSRRDLTILKTCESSRTPTNSRTMFSVSSSDFCRKKSCAC